MSNTSQVTKTCHPAADDRSASTGITAFGIRSVDATAAAALAEIGTATILETYADLLPADAIAAFCAGHHSPAAWHALLTSPGTLAWLARAPNGSAAGYALLTPPDLPGQQDGDAELRRIYVRAVRQGGGLGRALLDTAAAAARAGGARRMLLGVNARNLPAIGFYGRAGFVNVATRVFRVGTLDCDDLVLALSL